MAITLNGSTGITTDIDGDESLTLNRDTSDGDIITLQKDGTTVGSIKSADGVRLVVDSIADGKLSRNGTELVTWTSDSFRPTTDNSYDLGRSATRWQDLYLSGGVYVGGTGSANYLDDYEEGTFTPAYTPSSGSFSTISYANQGGSYVKVGKVVHVQIRLRTSDVVLGTASGALNIIGLPFTVQNDSTNARNAVSFSVVSTFGSKYPISGYAENNSTYIRPLYRDTTNGNDNNFDVSQLATGSGIKNSVFISATYTVD